MRRKILTVRNSAHRKKWPNYSSKCIPRESEFELFGFCQVLRPSDIALDLRGTPYEIQVWNLLREIAVGETTSYGALAAKLGTRDARDVTVAISTNPVAILVPCHRVIKKDGSISGYRWGVPRKRALLEREQLVLRGRK